MTERDDREYRRTPRVTPRYRTDIARRWAVVRDFRGRREPAAERGDFTVRELDDDAEFHLDREAAAKPGERCCACPWPWPICLTALAPIGRQMIL